MTHPLVPPIWELAAPIADSLDLEVVDISFQTNKRPPVLRVDIRNRQGDTGLDDCERMSRAVEAVLDRQPLIPGAYVLEVSSPGVSRRLTTDREFEAFKGFSVLVKTDQPVPKEWRGNLQGRDETAIYLQQKGKAIAIPRAQVTLVQLSNSTP
jgi:ribosome maturation factor RimP